MNQQEQIDELNRKVEDLSRRLAILEHNNGMAPPPQTPEGRRRKKHLWIPIVAVILVAAIAAGVILVPRIAGSSVGSSSSNATEAVAIGDIVTMGIYEQDNNTPDGAEPIEWIVLDKTEDSMLLISRYILDYQEYRHIGYEPTRWSKSSLRDWLNEDFYNSAFTPEEQAKIKVTTLEPGTGDNTSTEDRLFVFSVSELEQYFTDNTSRATTFTPYAAIDMTRETWWTRTKQEDTDKSLMVVEKDGNIDNGRSASNCAGVRPAMWVSSAR